MKRSSLAPSRRDFPAALALLAAGAVLLQLGCTHARQGDTVSRNDPEFRERVDQLARAYESLDLEKIAAFYAPDALTLTFDVPAKYDTGAAAARATAERFLVRVKDVKIALDDTIEVWRWPDKVWTLRGFDVQGTRKPGGQVAWKGRHSAIWEQRGGAWVIVNEHFLNAP